MNRFDWLEFDQSPKSGNQTPKPARNGEVPGRMPHDAAALYEQARRMRRAGYFDGAAKLYERAVGLSEYHYPACAEMIDSLVRAENIDEADVHARAALDNYRQVRLFYASRALVLAYKEVYDEAFAASDVSLEGEPSWYAHCVRAEILLHFSVDYRSEALGFLEKALNIAKDVWEPAFLAGFMLLKAGFPPLAAAYFSEAAHADTRAEAGWLYLGDCFNEMRLFDQAMFYYQKVMEFSPKHEFALERQRKCAPALFGLTRAFRKEDLRKRWNREYEKLNADREKEKYDF